MCTRSGNVDYVHESVWLCVVIEPAHTRYKTKSHCPRAMGSSFKEPSKWQGQGSMELIRPLGHGLRQQFLLLMLGDSLHRRTKRDKVNLKVFLSHCSSSTFDLLMAPGQDWMSVLYVGVDKLDIFLLIANRLTSLNRFWLCIKCWKKMLRP